MSQAHSSCQKSCGVIALKRKNADAHLLPLNKFKKPICTPTPTTSPRDKESDEESLGSQDTTYSDVTEELDELIADHETNLSIENDRFIAALKLFSSKHFQ